MKHNIFFQNSKITQINNAFFLFNLSFTELLETILKLMNFLYLFIKIFNF